MSNLDSKPPKAPYIKTINPSKVRENVRLRLRKDKMAAAHRQKRLQSYKKQFVAPSTLKLNLSDLEITIEHNFKASFNSNPQQLGFLLAYIDSFLSSPNNENLIYVKFCLCHLYLITSSLKEDEAERTKIEQQFTSNRCSNLITLMCTPNIEQCISYEIALILNELSLYSSRLCYLFSAQENVSKIFNLLLNSTMNYPFGESVLHIIANLLYDKNCFRVVCNNTEIANYVFRAIPIVSTETPLSFVCVLFENLTHLMKDSYTVISMKKEVMEILPLIKKYLSTDINPYLFQEVLFCLNNILHNLTQEEINEGAEKLFEAKFEILLDKYIEINTDPVILEKIFNIFCSLSYLHDKFIYNMFENSQSFEKISNYLDFVISSPNSKSDIHDVLFSLFSFIFNAFTLRNIKLYILRKTKIVQDIIVILINNLVEANLIAMIIEDLLELIKGDDGAILTSLLVIDFPQIVLVSQLNNEALNELSQLNILIMIEKFMGYGENILSDNSNLLSNSFEQLGIGMLIEKKTGSKYQKVSQKAEEIYKEYFEKNENK